MNHSSRVQTNFTSEARNEAELKKVLCKLTMVFRARRNRLNAGHVYSQHCELVKHFDPLRYQCLTPQTTGKTPNLWNKRQCQLSDLCYRVRNLITCL